VKRLGQSALAVVIWAFLLAAECGAQDFTRTSGYRLTPFSPPAWYKSAWRYAKECSALKGRPGHGFKEVIWFTYPLGTAHEPGNAQNLVLGWWHSDTIAIADKHVGTPWVVRHELLHQLIWGRSDPFGHPAFPFRFPCGLMGDQQHGQPAERATQARPFRITVENRGFQDVVVYDVSRGHKQRLGHVSGMRTETFRVTSPDRRVQLLVHQMAGVDWVSDWIATVPGTHGELVVHGHLPLSSISVYPGL
jgi:hypothetical protein